MPERPEGGETAVEESTAPGQSLEDMEKGERPQMAEGGKGGGRSPMPGGAGSEERPEMPEGMEEGEKPEMPEGMENGKMPEGGRGGNGFGQMSAEDAVTEFEIKAGGNMFMVVGSQTMTE